MLVCWGGARVLGARFRCIQQDARFLPDCFRSTAEHYKFEYYVEIAIYVNVNCARSVRFGSGRSNGWMDGWMDGHVSVHALVSFENHVSRFSVRLGQTYAAILWWKEFLFLFVSFSVHFGIFLFSISTACSVVCCTKHEWMNDVRCISMKWIWDFLCWLIALRCRFSVWANSFLSLSNPLYLYYGNWGPTTGSHQIQKNLLRTCSVFLYHIALLGLRRHYLPFRKGGKRRKAEFQLKFESRKINTHTHTHSTFVSTKCISHHNETFPTANINRANSM